MAKRALLVGLNSYPDPENTLHGCLNDVRAVRALLQEHYGFQAGHDVRLLTDADATTRAITSGLRWLVADARDGDVLVFHYSGHGSQVRDRDGDEVSDGLDEILCPYDLDWDRPLRDDDLYEIVKGLPRGAALTVILDCCHAGTGLREAPAPVPNWPVAAWPSERSKCIEPPLRLQRARRPVHRFGQSAAGSGALLIAACRDDQSSADAFIHGDYHGALTYYLCEAIAAGGYAGTYDAVIREVRRQLRLNRFDQVPQLEGPAAARRHPVFAPAAAAVCPA